MFHHKYLDKVLNKTLMLMGEQLSKVTNDAMHSRMDRVKFVEDSLQKNWSVLVCLVLQEFYLVNY